ncbi:MAG: hypothetical protein ACRDAM_01875 [Casimicrobium sp.]
MAKPLLIATLEELSEVDTIGIVIGIDTRIFTTLAVVSSAHHLRIPLLLIDGYSNDGSLETLRELDLPVESWLIRMERRVHGVLIDKLVRELRSKRVLLIDSDVEVKTPAAFEAMTVAMDSCASDRDNIYAAGCSHGDHSMENDGMPHVWFPRRPWIPFTLLDRVRCLELVEQQTTFEAKRIGNEFPVQWVASLLLKRGHFAFSKSWQFAFLEPLRKTRRGVRAAFYIYDTGALIYETAELRQWHFADIGWETMNASVLHYEGATRSTEVQRWTGESEDELNLTTRLAEKYGVELRNS